MFHRKPSTRIDPLVLFESRDKKYNISDFEIKNVIGSGSFGSVRLAKDKETNLLVAIKTYKKRDIINQKIEMELFHELYHHSLVNHLHVTKLLKFFHDEDMVYFVLEYCKSGSLFQELRQQKNKRFSEMMAAKYIFQISSGLKYCHDLDFMHGDLKPENILLDANKNAKITDFGLSWPLDDTAFLYRGYYHGTLEYMAPELFNKELYNEKIDHWSLGIMCYEMLVGRTTFYSKNKNLLIKRILDIDIHYPKIVTMSAQHFINKLLRFIPKDRLSLEDVMTDDWINYNRKGSD